MKERLWKDAENGTHYYFEKQNGLIVGQAYNYAHTKIWGAKIPINADEDKILGRFIDCDFAKKSIEEYWNVQDRTLIE